MTNAELTILSLIAECPRHGYEIEQTIEARGMRDWTEIGFSSIYYLLNKLEDAGLIKSEIQITHGRGSARKVYSLTEKGNHRHQEGIVQALGEPHSASVPFLLGLSNYPVLPTELVLDSLRKNVARLEKRLNHLLQRVEEQGPLPPFVEAIFDYSRTMVEAELTWMNKFIEEVEAGNV
jgi:DNA-binding PadR family transcriptional regulator